LPPPGDAGNEFESRPLQIADVVKGVLAGHHQLVVTPEVGRCVGDSVKNLQSLASLHPSSPFTLSGIRRDTDPRCTVDSNYCAAGTQ
jgi:hypothetical protein